jgi:hypothetical protein
VLHIVIRHHLDDFLRTAADRVDGAGLPEFIAREFREFLTCGVLAHGFARVRCGRCALDVNSQQIVLAKDSADGWLTAESAVPPMAIVVVQPAGKGRRAESRGQIGEGVGPFTQQGLDEAFRLAVRLGSVGARETLGQALRPAARSDEVGAIGIAIVAQDALGLDAAPAKPRQGPAQEPNDGGRSLVGQHLGIGQARTVIDTDVDKLPADPAGALAPIGRDAIAEARDAPQLLGVYVRQLPGPSPFVAARGRRRRSQGAQAGEAELAQGAGHRGGP